MDMSRREMCRRTPLQTVKNVLDGPFFELDVALTMGVMKHRRKPGISSNEGQKWWRQLISKPLMWDLRVAVTPASRTASKSKKKPPTTSSLEDDARRRREGAAAPRNGEIRRRGSARRGPGPS